MPQLDERLSEYMTYMGLRQVDIARALGMKPQRVNQWFPSDKLGVKLKTPFFDDLVTIADRLGVSLDFLAGRTSEMWSPQIWAARIWLQGQLDRVSGKNDRIYPMNLRMRSVMRIMSEQVPLLSESWFAAGVLGVPVEAYEHFLHGRGSVTPLMLSRLGRFCGVSEKWLMGGAEEDLAPVASLGEYTNGVARVIARGIPGERFEQLIDLVLQAHAIM